MRRCGHCHHEVCTECDSKRSNEVCNETEFLKVVKISTVIFWAVSPCSLIGGYQLIKDIIVSIFRVEIKIFKVVF